MIANLTSTTLSVNGLPDDLTLEQVTEICGDWQGHPAGRYTTMEIEQIDLESPRTLQFEGVRSESDAECIMWLLQYGLNLEEEIELEVIQVTEYDTRY